jgi:hypothetical protein
MRPTGCAQLGFNPTAAGAMGSPGETNRGAFPPVQTTLRFNPEEAALSRAEVTLPDAIAANIGAVNRACSRAQADASACPASSRVGTAIIDSPLQPKPVRGPVYIAFNTNAALPGLVVMLPAPVGVRLDGVVDVGAAGIKNTFAGNPDLPVRTFTLALAATGTSSALRLTKDLCAGSTDRNMTVSLLAHNGKTATFKQELATPGCDPVATVAIRRKGRRAKLVLRMKAGRDGPGLTGFTMKLPKTLLRGKARPRLRAGGRSMRARTRKRRASRTFPNGVRSATLVWRGLRVGRRLRRNTTIRLSLKDSRPNTTSLKQKVRVRGKFPKRRRR